VYDAIATACNDKLLPFILVSYDLNRITGHDHHRCYAEALGGDLAAQTDHHLIMRMHDMG
jgi:hypothetical protein